MMRVPKQGDPVVLVSIPGAPELVNRVEHYLGTTGNGLHLVGCLRPKLKWVPAVLHEKFGDKFGRARYEQHAVFLGADGRWHHENSDALRSERGRTDG